ncbi:hypothetical protein C8J57DRAFT_1526633 [Mycena rebaudengoi]|nr:hypothetical protein C8J57DRAFT_1526633 [Mycena rebaudengoi]
MHRPLLCAACSECAVRHAFSPALPARNSAAHAAAGRAPAVAVHRLLEIRRPPFPPALPPRNSAAPAAAGRAPAAAVHRLLEMHHLPRLPAHNSTTLPLLDVHQPARHCSVRLSLVLDMCLPVLVLAALPPRDNTVGAGTGHAPAAPVILSLLVLDAHLPVLVLDALPPCDNATGATAGCADAGAGTGHAPATPVVVGAGCTPAGAGAGHAPAIA